MEKQILRNRTETGIERLQRRKDLDKRVFYQKRTRVKVSVFEKNYIQKAVDTLIIELRRKRPD
jgi:hypothetical protein